MIIYSQTRLLVFDHNKCTVLVFLRLFQLYIKATSFCNRNYNVCNYFRIKNI